MMRQQEVQQFLAAALECSVYVAPKDPGLTHAELFEAGGRVGYQEGELGDALRGVAAQMYFGDSRLMPRAGFTWSQFNIPEEPDYRKIEAFDFVCAQLQAQVRSVGAAHAQLDRTVLVARAVATQLPEHDVDVAVTILVLSGHLTEGQGVLRFVSGRENYPLPSEQARGGHPMDCPQQKPARAQAYPIIRDIISRRRDGRSTAAEPLDAFASELEKLGYGLFRMWWTQSVAELRQLQPNQTPVAHAVLAAALVEGALTFVVKHARGLGLGVFGSKDFERDPRTWKIDELVSGASAGQGSAILDSAARFACRRVGEGPPAYPRGEDALGVP